MVEQTLEQKIENGLLGLDSIEGKDITEIMKLIAPYEVNTTDKITILELATLKELKNKLVDLIELVKQDDKEKVNEFLKRSLFFTIDLENSVVLHLRAQGLLPETEAALEKLYPAPDLSKVEDKEEVGDDE